MTQAVYAAATPEPEHQHRWRKLPDSVGLFSCVDGRCSWYVVCPCCLGSWQVALLAYEGIEGMVLYWCPAHQGGGVYDREP